MKPSDSDKTDVMRSLLRMKYSQSHGNGNRHVLIEELGNSTGYACNRHADAAVFDLWKSDGYGLHGFELKASRADLRKELDNPAKHHAIYRYCVDWTLVTFDTAVVGTLMLPDHWSWWTVTPDHSGFEVQRRAKKDRSRQPDPFPLDFVAALVRHAAKSDPAASYVALAIEQVRHLLDWKAKRKYEDQLGYAENRVAALERQLAELTKQPATGVAA